MAEKKEEKILVPDPEEVVERRYMRESEHGGKNDFLFGKRHGDIRSVR